jgi:lipoprotein signal peptidase
MILALIALGVDQAIKQLFLITAPQLTTINTGIAFGLGSAAWTLIGILLFVLFGRITAFQPKKAWWLLGAMTISNLIDRTRLGGVVDYITLGQLQLNLTDIAICTLVLIIFLDTKKGA